MGSYLLFVLVNLVVYWQAKFPTLEAAVLQQNVKHFEITENNPSDSNNITLETSQPPLIKNPFTANSNVNDTKNGNSVIANSRSSINTNLVSTQQPLMTNSSSSVLNATSNENASVREPPLEKPSLRYTDKPFFSEEVINHHNFGYTIAPKVNCSTRKVEILICVPISHGNFQGRAIIRETWGSYALNTSNNAFLVFFIGSAPESSNKSQNNYSQQKLQEEAAKYDDIVQENFTDTYNNLSLKSVSILKYASVECPGAKFVLKADDDMYVNIPLLVDVLREWSLNSSIPSAFVMGSMQVGVRPIRNPDSKWYTPLSVYEDKIYPNYVSGTAYAMTNETAYLLYEASLRIRIFWLEDVYITGLCAKKAEVPLYNSRYFTIGKPTPTGCIFRKRITGHKYSHAQIMQIYKELNDSNLKC